ncbi:MAG: type II secretion system minor pseudopilin GspK [Magnetococcales bacterium]|nr:type II secretion system minor pseudopilin GspK [Magnetococcales bacterium]
MTPPPLRTPPRSPREEGAALITALLVVALTVMLAVGMAEKQRLELRRTTRLGEYARAWQVALGTEVVSRSALIQDTDQDKLRSRPNIDALGDEMFRPLVDLPVEGGLGKVSIGREDLQGRFNLNNLVTIPQGMPNGNEINRFRRLLRNLGHTESLVDRVVDWIDPDMEVTHPDGAEDETYLNLTPPYRPANRPMAQPQELLRVKGFTREIYLTLAPYITALPENTALNVNTAPVEVLRTLHEDFSLSSALNLVELRGLKGFSNVQDFAGACGRAGILPDNMAGLGVETRYILSTAVVQWNDSRVILRSVMIRPPFWASVLHRVQETF